MTTTELGGGPTAAVDPAHEVDARILALSRVLMVGLVLLATLRIAWIGDDALITLRTALNITHGWGPGFNATEAVEGYTHPLWFLLWVGIGALSGQWILGVLGISIALTGSAVALIAWRTTTVSRLIVVTGLLLLSNAFIEYTTSGLENPLAFLTIGTLIALTLETTSTSSGRQLARAALVGLTVAAVLLTRLDLGVLILPAVAVHLAHMRTDPQRIAALVTAAVIPLAAWFAWSKATYDAWLPNTFAAKRNLDIPIGELFVQGIRYLWVTFASDPVTLIALAVGVGATFALGDRITRAWAIGVLVYVAYIVWIGGDFMVGRFLAVPVYVSVFLIATLRPLPGARAPVELLRVLVALVIVLALAAGTAMAGQLPVALSASQTPRWNVDWNINGGIADERAFWGADRAIGNIVFNLALAYTKPDFVGPSTGASMGRSLREIDKAARDWPTTAAYIGKPIDVAVFCGGLGEAGISSGPQVHLIDDCGLTDRFLAERTFTARGFQWRTGDFHRAVPDGYVDAIRADNPGLMKSPADAVALAVLWRRIRPHS